MIVIAGFIGFVIGIYVGLIISDNEPEKIKKSKKKKASCTVLNKEYRNFLNYDGTEQPNDEN